MGFRQIAAKLSTWSRNPLAIFGQSLQDVMLTGIGARLFSLKFPSFHSDSYRHCNHIFRVTNKIATK
jgi:hypothetical protein